MEDIMGKIYIFIFSLAVAVFISKQDAHAKYVQGKYGLVPLPSPRWGHEGSTEDQTAKILAKISY